MKIIAYFLFLTTFSIQTNAAENITEIKILNSEFKVIRIINKKNELKVALNEWSSLKPIKTLPNTNWTHKIDIESKSIGGRWLYNEKGYVAKLNKQLKPIYKVKNVKLFNKIYLGL